MTIIQMKCILLTNHLYMHAWQQRPSLHGTTHSEISYYFMCSWVLLQPAQASCRPTNSVEVLRSYHHTPNLYNYRYKKKFLFKVCKNNCLHVKIMLTATLWYTMLHYNKSSTEKSCKKDVLLSCIPHLRGGTWHWRTENRSSCRLRSSYCHRLAVLSVKLSIGSCSFSVSGPTVWNALPDYLRNPTLPTDVFKSYSKTFFFAYY